MTKIIAFEGIDGTGKSVQMERLSKTLTKAGRQVLTLSFPVYTAFFGAEVGRLLSGRDGVSACDVEGRSMALWYALDRFEALKDFDMRSADFLLINRYVLSNAVYQSIRDCDLGKPDLLDFVLELEYEHFYIPRADAHLVLDMAPANAALNVDKKGFRDYVGDARDVYEAIPSIQERARLKYLEYAERLDNVYVIQCMGQGRLKGIDEIADDIANVLTDIL